MKTIKYVLLIYIVINLQSFSWLIKQTQMLIKVYKNHIIEKNMVFSFWHYVGIDNN